MKFFHLSDLHIGLKLLNRDLSADQQHVFAQISSYARQEQPDAIVIAGDIYDKAVPSAEAVALFDRLIDDLTEAVPGAEIMLISGNHDSGQRLNCFRQVLARQHVHVIGLPPRSEEERIAQVTLEDAYGPVHFYLLPFVKPSMVKQIVGTDENGNNLSYQESLQRLIGREEICPEERNVLVSHQFYLPAGVSAEDVERMESEVRTAGNIDEVSAEMLKQFDYAALGHIHKPMKVGSEVFRYCGTPLACSVSEAGQRKGILMVELGAKMPFESESMECVAEAEQEGEAASNWKADIRITTLPLAPLHEVRRIRGTLKEVLRQSCNDYVSVLLTDQVDLDVFDLQDRIRSAFPNLLEIRRETWRKTDYGTELVAEKQMDPFALCCAFLGNPDETEQAILLDVVQTVQTREG